MYQVLYNSEHSPVDIAKWLNDELALGNKLVACNGDFYIFEAVEHSVQADIAECTCEKPYQSNEVDDGVCGGCLKPFRNAANANRWADTP